MIANIIKHLNGNIAYEDYGCGPLVVCVPSLGDLRGEYRFLTEPLVSAGFRVVMMDVRGHGESSTAWDDYSVAGVGSDIVTLIEFLNAGPAAIIGTSMAAGAAVWAAAEHPEQVRQLVLIGPFVRGNTSAKTRALYRALFSRPWGPWLWQMYYASLYRTRKPGDFAKYSSTLRQNLQENGRMEALYKMMIASKDASEERLPQVNAPSLVLMGSKDPDFKSPEDEAQWVANSLKGEYRMIADAGHYPHAEMPDVTAPIIREFLLEHFPEAGKLATPKDETELEAAVEIEE